MAALGTVLLIIGFIGMIVGSIWFLIEAFNESVMWGLGCFFVPFVSLFFLIMHFDRACKPFLVQIISLVPIVLGMLIGRS